MVKNGAYQYSVVDKLSFVRYGGTDGEKRAAQIIMDEIEAAGGKGEYMEFTVPAYDVKKCRVCVTAPFTREITAEAHGLSGSIKDGGADLRFVYAENGTEADFYGLGDLSDAVVMINELNFDAYKLLCMHKAAAFITVFGKYYDTDDTSVLYPRPMRPKFLENGTIPGFSVRASDAVNMVRDGAQMIHLELIEDEYENTSRDVLAVIPGTVKPEESIVITAHYDSVMIGTGSWDNATGAATILYLYRYFLENAPARTLRFVWCGSEEQGLLGSKAFIAQNEDLIKDIKFCFNFDMCGTVVGFNRVTCTGGDDLKAYAEQFCREIGHSASIEVRVHSSDSAPFADRGIPGIGLSRSTKVSEIHTKNDLLFPLSADALSITGDFAVKFIERTANSVIIPVSTGMPDDMKKALDKYFQRDKIPYKPEASEDK